MDSIRSRNRGTTTTSTTTKVVVVVVVVVVDDYWICMGLEKRKIVRWEVAIPFSIP